ncbi:unnamed protein product [Symbiodinium microadriaticum]|nr:unnamed protein product [Symbiodinium microadriaticum]
MDPLLSKQSMGSLAKIWMSILKDILDEYMRTKPAVSDVSNDRDIFEAHEFMGDAAIEAWVEYNAGTLRARAVKVVKLYRKTPDRSKSRKVQILKNILSKFDAEPREETNTDEAQAAAHDDDVDNNGVDTQQPTDEIDDNSKVPAGADQANDGSIRSSEKDRSALVADPRTWEADASTKLLEALDGSDALAMQAKSAQKAPEPEPCDDADGASDDEDEGEEAVELKPAMKLRGPRSNRKPDEIAAQKTFPALERYRVMPYWSRRECGVVTKDDSKTQAACSDSVARTRNE